MAAAKIGYRGNAIGISAGLGIALPLAAYAATLPFDGVNNAVRADALPFAAGIVAGVGMLALTGHLIDRHAERVAEDEAEAARFASLYDGSSTRADSAQTMTKGAAPRGKRFARGGAPAGVPVISRAVDALDEMEAWAEIDAMFNEDSPISCDPARSKDMYQIALEELSRLSAQPPRRSPLRRLMWPPRGLPRMRATRMRRTLAMRPWPPCTATPWCSAPMPPSFPTCPRVRTHTGCRGAGCVLS